jgi:[calcium/calmodulin-dependent protein kinase] kinase
MAIMKKINHENLIQLIEIIDDTEKGKIYFIMDYMDLCYLGSPQHLVHINCKKKYLPDDKLLFYFRECLSGIDYRKFV